MFQSWHNLAYRTETPCYFFTNTRVQLLPPTQWLCCSICNDCSQHWVRKSSQVTSWGPSSDYSGICCPIVGPHAVGPFCLPRENIVDLNHTSVGKKENSVMAGKHVLEAKWFSIFTILMANLHIFWMLRKLLMAAFTRMPLEFNC